MANSFFELKNSLNEVDEEFPDLEEDEYDALNDETFGSDAIVEDEDWEDTHTLLAAQTESFRGRHTPPLDTSASASAVGLLSRLLLSNEEAPQRREVSPPLPLLPPQLSRIPTVEELERNLLEGKARASSSPRAAAAGTPQRVLPTAATAVSPSAAATARLHRPLPPPPGLGAPIRGFGAGVGGVGGVPPFPHQMAAKQGMGLGMFPGQGHMPPHIAQEYMMMRSQYDKMGMGMFMPGMPMMPPRVVHPPNMMFPRPPMFNPQMFGSNMHVPHPPHPILFPQMNQHKTQQHLSHHPNLNHLNWQQKQLYDRNSGNDDSDRDEYAKLMNNRERTWLLNIQMMQLATENPHIDDYYYTMWKKKHPTPRKPQPLSNGFHQQQQNQHKNHKRPEPFFANNRSSDSNTQQRERRESESSTTASPRVYVPLQFENSLGKLQCKSVIAPRVVFDMEVVSESQSGTPAGAAYKDHRKTKKTLLDLERLYLLMLDAEEADDGDSERVERVLSGLLAEDRFLSFLCIRKGKTLLLRCLGHVTDWEVPMLTELWSRLLKAFPTVLRRDKDDALLPKLYPYLSLWAHAASPQALLTVATSVLGGAREGREPREGREGRTSVLRASPCPTKPLLSYILSNQLGVSAVSLLLMQGEESGKSLLVMQGEESGESAQWNTFVEELVKSIANLDTLDHVVKPIEPIPHNVLTVILNRRCSHLNSHVHAKAKQVLSTASS